MIDSSASVRGFKEAESDSNTVFVVYAGTLTSSKADTEDTISVTRTTLEVTEDVVVVVGATVVTDGVG